MRITNLRNEPHRTGFQRLTVDVEYKDSSREQVWYALPEDIPPSRTGNPWLALMLPLAAASGEDLRVDLPVDAWLLQNAETLVRLWTFWYPELAKPVRLFAEALPPSVPQPGVSCSFTAGVDSFFTVLRHPESRHYINVLGLDMPLWKSDAHDRLTARLEAAAHQLGARLIRMATNVRETRWGKLPWENYASGAAISAAHLHLERLCGAGLIPSSCAIEVLEAWGLHPLSCPMFSTSSTRIVYDGAGHTRAQKLENIVENRIVRENLHVCFLGQDTHGQDDTNCSRCGKCIRTMLVLDILGKLQDCKTFDPSGYRVELAGCMDVTHPVNRSFHDETRELALRKGRLDIVRQIDLSLKRSRRAQLLDRFAGWPFLWRLPYYYRRHAFGALAHLQRIEPPPAASSAAA